MARSRRTRLILRILISAVSTLVALELLCRYLVASHDVKVVPLVGDRPWIASDATLGFRLVPGNHDGEHINRWGLRGADFKATKPPGCLRIIMIGGSTTFGNKVGDNQTIPFYTAGFLRKTRSCVQVINAGLEGARSIHHRLRLQKMYLNWQPDLIVVNVDLNDLGGYLVLGSDWRPNNLSTVDMLVSVPPFQLWWLKHSALYRVFYSERRGLILRGHVRALASAPDLSRALAAPLAALAQNLTAMGRMTEARGARFVLVNLPWFFRDDRFKAEATECAHRKDIGAIAQWARLLEPLRTSPRLVVAATVDKVSRLHHLQVIHCGHLFDSLPLDERVKLFHDAIHPAPEGYRDIARCISNGLAPTIRGIRGNGSRSE